MIGLDHHYPGSNDSPIVVILYAEIGTAAFSQWHAVLQKKAEQGDLDYVLRHYVHVSLIDFGSEEFFSDPCIFLCFTTVIAMFILKCCWFSH